MAKVKYYRITARNVCKDILLNHRGQRCAIGHINTALFGHADYPRNGGDDRTRLERVVARLAHRLRLPRRDLWAVANWNNDQRTPLSTVARAINALKIPLAPKRRKAKQH